MTNEEIVKLICKIESLNIDNYQPFNENNQISDNDFDKRFELDRTYHRSFYNFRKRIRFVKYPSDNYISMYINTLYVSNLNLNIFGAKIVKSKNYTKKIPINIIERYDKIKKIQCRLN